MNALKRNNVVVLGDGPETILFAHGFGGNQSAWKLVADKLSSKFKIILFDYVGVGGSDVSAYDFQKYSILKGYAQDVLDICEALHLKHINYVGHSVSGIVGLLASIEKPDFFKKIVMLGPSPCYLNLGEYQGGINPEDLQTLFDAMEDNYDGWAQAMAPAVMGNTENPALGCDLVANWQAYDPAIAKNFVKATFESDNRHVLRYVRTSSLSVIGDNDVLASEAAIQYIWHHTPGNEILRLSFDGHCPQLSAPDLVADVICEYIYGSKDVSCAVA